MAPYYKPGKAWRANLDFSGINCGVYLIRSKRTKKIVYVGSSQSNLKKTLYRHFQSWDDPTQYRATYDRNHFEIKVISCACSVAPILEKAFIQKYSPRDNHMKYKGSFFAKRVKKLPTKFNTSNPEKSDFVPF